MIWRLFRKLPAMEKIRKFQLHSFHRILVMVTKQERRLASTVVGQTGCHQSNPLAGQMWPAMRKFPTNDQKLSTVISLPEISPQVSRWNNAFQNGAALVDQSKNETSVMKILDEINFHQHLLGVLGSGHPFLLQLRSLLLDTRVNYQLHGLVALLLSKATNHTQRSDNYEEARQCGGISCRQRRVADALELYRVSFLIHKSVLNLDYGCNSTLQKANGMAVLAGDYLAASASVILGEVKDNKVLAIISKGVNDITESGFVGEMDKHGNVLPDHSRPFDVWEEASLLSNGSLLAQGCQAVVYLGGHDNQMQEKCNNFARYFTMALKVNKELSEFRKLSKYVGGTPFSLDLLPVIMHLENDPELLQHIRNDGKEDICFLNFGQVYSAVQNGNGQARSIELLVDYVGKAEDSLTSSGILSCTASDILMEMLDATRWDEKCEF